MWLKTNQWKIPVPMLVLAVLAAAFWFGSGAPGNTEHQDLSASATQLPGEEGDSAQEQPAGQTKEPAALPEGEAEPVEGAAAPAQGTASSAPAETPTGIEAAPPPEGQGEEPAPVEPQDVVVGSAEYTCTMSIRCATVLDHLDRCDPDKVELLPEDEWVLEPVTVSFYEGESVFNVLQRVCKQQKIHMEYEDTPMYNSAYIEGIANLYEFDVGELSGWMYQVNGWFPNYGCSRYQLHDGDVIDWVYTCDLGGDVGGEYSAGNGYCG